MSAANFHGNEKWKNICIEKAKIGRQIAKILIEAKWPVQCHYAQTTYYYNAD